MYICVLHVTINIINVALDTLLCVCVRHDKLCIFFLNNYD